MTQTTRRTILRHSALSGATVALAACGAAADRPHPAGPVQAPAQSTRVEVWHGWTGARQPLVEQIFAKLTQQYPTLKIEPVVQGVNGEAGMTKLTATVAAGAPPDAIMIYQDLLPQYGPRTKVLATLDEYMRRDGVKKDLFYEADIAACAAQGKTWMLPHVLPNTYTGLLYNKALTARSRSEE